MRSDRKLDSWRSKSRGSQEEAVGVIQAQEDGVWWQVKMETSKDGTRASVCLRLCG